VFWLVKTKMADAKITCERGLFFLDHIPFRIDAEAAAERLKVSRDGEDFRFLEEMVREAEKTGVPKAVYRVSFPEGRTENSVVIEGVTFESRVLRVNLENVYRVFPYVVTCGEELELWSRKYTDPLLAYFADHIKQAVLSVSVNFLYGHIQKKYCLSKFSRMAPGSLSDWPIEQQRPFFEIMGNVKETIGVVLTESFLMLPSKSVSGIIFPTETAFESCMLCPREKCTGRRAPYDKNLYDKRYAEK